ncbi:MAG: hypothetical protein LBC02_04945 [Planctomycetaceae bacterium]|nr:hypothetical protein [Planctomycetaceae bacterium]
MKPERDCRSCRYFGKAEKTEEYGCRLHNRMLTRYIKPSLLATGFTLSDDNEVYYPACEDFTIIANRE